MGSNKKFRQMEWDLLLLLFFLLFYFVVVVVVAAAAAAAAAILVNVLRGLYEPPSRSNWTQGVRGPIASREGSVAVFLRKDKATCDSQGGGRTPCPRPLWL